VFRRRAVLTTPADLDDPVGYEERRRTDWASDSSLDEALERILGEADDQDGTAEGRHPRGVARGALVRALPRRGPPGREGARGTRRWVARDDAGGRAVPRHRELPAGLPRRCGRRRRAARRAGPPCPVRTVAPVRRPSRGDG